MSNLINSFYLPELKFYLLLNYTFVWYFLYNACGLVRTQQAIRLKLINVFFYSIVPTSLALTLIQQGFTRQFGLTSVQIHLLLIIVAYYIFSTLEEFRTKSTYNWSIIIHHVAFGIVIFLVAIDAKIPAYWLWVVAVQFSAIVVSFRSVLKEFPSIYNRVNPILEQCDFILFLCSRMIFQTVVMILAVADMYYTASMNYIILVAFLLSLLLNSMWFFQILKRRTIAKMQLAMR